MTHDRIVVIGGGIGGLAAATRLAHRGFSVDLFEQHPTVGGKMGRHVLDGCTFDTGPSLITMPFVFEQFFASVGTSLERELTLTRIDPQCHYRWADGTRIAVRDSIDEFSEAIASIHPADGKAVRTYMERAQRVYEATKDVFIFNAFDGIGEFFKPRNLPLLPKLPSLRFTQTLHELHREMFTDARVVQLFDRFATYNGSTPYRAPATLMVIPYVEFAFGAWYPQGGMYAMAEAFERVARRNGVRIHTSTMVQRILVDRTRIAGVQLADGSTVVCDHVISNMDTHLTQTMLLGNNVQQPRERSMSGVVVLMSVRADDHGLGHHNVLFGTNYQEEFNDIVARERYATDMTIYIARSCHTDPTQAPPGVENWFTLINAPATTNEPPTDYVDRIIERMSLYGVHPHVRAQHVFTPTDLAARTMSYRGALYGASSNSMFSAFLRQRQRSSQVKNLWYVGGSAHPGGGVPLVTISGMIASDLITKATSS